MALKQGQSRRTLLVLIVFVVSGLAITGYAHKQSTAPSGAAVFLGNPDTVSQNEQQNSTEGNPGSDNAKPGNAFSGTWVENTDGSPGLKIIIDADLLTISGPGIDELHSGFETGGRFTETMNYTITKDTEGRDSIESMIRGQDCTMSSVETSSIDFHCFAGTELFMHRR